MSPQFSDFEPFDRPEWLAADDSYAMHLVEAGDVRRASRVVVMGRTAYFLHPAEATDKDRDRLWQGAKLEALQDFGLSTRPAPEMRIQPVGTWRAHFAPEAP